MPKAVDISGQRFGRLVAKDVVYIDNVRLWRCLCDCGNYTHVNAGKLRIGNTTSCGCWKKAVLGISTTKHGMRSARTYGTWKGMRNRCNNPNTADYPRWGGRGIRVCERWDDFANFYADMGEPPVGTTLDRINNDGNYEPDNCRWATRSEQARNQKRQRPRNKTIHIKD